MNDTTLPPMRTELSEVIRLINGVDADRKLQETDVEWAEELIDLLAPSLQTLITVGGKPEVAASMIARLPAQVEVVQLPLGSVIGQGDCAFAQALQSKPDLVVADCRGCEPAEVELMVSALCAAAAPVLMEFDPLDADKVRALLRRYPALETVRALDMLGEEISLAVEFSDPIDGRIALVPRFAATCRVPAALASRTSRRTGVPPYARALAPKPYVRKVEVVSLATAAKLTNCQYERKTLAAPDFDIYSRRYADSPEAIELAWLHDVDVLPHPAWKICVQDRYLVDEVGYSKKNMIFGMECWPEFGGYWSIRRQLPHIHVPRKEGSFLLVGGDTSYYHWLLNWVPRLMAKDVMADYLPPLRSLKVVVPWGQVPKYLELLYELGLPRENVVQLSSEAIWRFEELIVPNFFSSGRLSPSVAHWYRTQLRTERAPKPSKRILISRRDASMDGPPRRRVANETELAAALAPLGFERYELSDMSVRQQIELFQQAEFVIGPHGAGFVNMIFSRPGTKAIVLENSWNHTFMVDMVNVSGGAACSIVCNDVIDIEYEAQNMIGNEVEPEVRRNRDMLVDVNAVVAEAIKLIAA